MIDDRSQVNQLSAGNLVSNTVTLQRSWARNGVNLVVTQRILFLRFQR